MSDPIFSYADDAMPPVKRGLIRLVEATTGQGNRIWIFAIDLRF